MNNPSLYSSVNDIEKRDAQLVLDKVILNLTWSENEMVLDVGCGPGDLTVTLLRSYLPKDARIIGCDISESMVNYAQSTYGNEQFSFRQLDIGNSNIWMNWEEGSFDKVFSFYCLNWVKEQKQAAQNMYELLKKDGHMITMFTTEHPFLKLFQDLRTHPKWKAFSKVWNTWNVFYTNKSPKEEYNEILRSCNFEIISSTTNTINFSHDSVQDFNGYLESVNPFVKKISPSEAKLFLEECTQSMLDQGLIVKTEKGGINHKYVVLITHAKKLS